MKDFPYPREINIQRFSIKPKTDFEDCRMEIMFESSRSGYIFTSSNSSNPENNDSQEP